MAGRDPTRSRNPDDHTPDDRTPDDRTQDDRTQDDRTQDDGTEDLLRVAAAAAELAHSPYSKIKVGAALLCRGGQVFTGCNVENASYGLTLCAERVAVVKAISAGERDFEAIAIFTDQPRTLMPCGACRQFLQEFAPALRVVCQGKGGARSEAKLSELLPRAFGPNDLR
jgi:cytidine deaminase